uniref:Uncharacterized protein n=1 Tax=Cannabis sativa TaxID=3483 RepID=A0A803PR07_CANSA
MTVGGAMFMTMYNGPMLNLPWAHPTIHHDSTQDTDNEASVKGAVMIASGCVTWSVFIILQAMTLASYPADAKPFGFC